jgi:DNA (cytosine-5)-methyltransferase 1
VPDPVVLDLFCGSGGMSLGFHMAGYRVGLGVEKENFPSQTHRLNFEGNCHHGDIREITAPAAFVREHGLEGVDVVIGGPPCQGFSRVGRGKIRSLRKDPSYIHDPRNQYYKEFIRFVEALRPSHFVMENVPDLQRYADGGGLLLDNAIQQFKNLGYENTEPRVLQADHFGVPQTRKRLFISGSLRDGKVPWPTPTHEGIPVTVWQAISDLPIIPYGHRQDEMIYQC